jgi:inositol-pentakisphosphate 2-kinase
MQFTPDNSHVAPQALREAFAAHYTPILLTSAVLPTLSRLQRTLDELDIEGLQTILSSNFSPAADSSAITSDLASVLQPISVDEWAAFLNVYESRIAAETLPPDDLSSISTSEARFYVLASLLSGTFKDCSLIVSSTDDIVKVIDADPKLPKKLPGWTQLDAKILQAYADVPEHKRRRCIDANRPNRRDDFIEEHFDTAPRRKPSPRGIGTLPFLLAATAVAIVASSALFFISGR